jgi:hypothetical protein
MNWNLFLFGLAGLAILWIISSISKKAPDSDFWPYAAGLLIVALLSYFFKEPVVQKLLMVAVALYSAHWVKGLTKVSVPKSAIAILLLLSICSCNSNTPNNKITGTEKVSTGWKPNATHTATVETFQTNVQIQPTLGQSAYFARQRGDHSIWNVVAVVLFLLFGVWVAGRLSDAKWFPDMEEHWVWIIAAILLAGAACSATWQTVSVYNNNKIVISKEHYDEVMQSAGSTQPIWDSLENGCHITWGPYKCFKK